MSKRQRQQQKLKATVRTILIVELVSVFQIGLILVFILGQCTGLTSIMLDNNQVINMAIKEFFVRTFLIIIFVTQCAAVLIITLIEKIVVNPVVEKIQRTKKISERDGMTGLFNRTKFYKEIEFYNECDSIAVMFIDVNDLKKANDTFGHRAGDELICEVCNAIKALQSENLEAYRFGGDEFVIVMINIAKAQIKEITEKLLKNISQIKLELSPIEVSVALGVAFEDGEIDIDTLIKQADARMYQCKKRQKKVD